MVIKAQEAKAFCFKATEQNAADEKTRNDKENIYADKAAFNPSGERMETDDGKYGDGS
ncbi:hypothetical protein ICHIJ1_05280 [Fluviibacter phosphoraccumulans]|uniref:Uncharacterized protein n=1 Tax=Fluviibacter phosphoraccumulans TaxID=1751046 RepID=A0A679HWZ2_9RHOO|nr:hypothetical protein ICHIAU1_01350 [Fluviibacter phosphoraccumulans]BBU70609.1 hypothetical protein ICHIJ1_05280 [Fluviibacter phosphoraccumulans]BCA66041.1 hypothetical protein SHINM1_016430 [Fluviibacter phosphoraccumulans]